MVTITAQKNPHSSTASGCVPGASRVVFYKFGQVDMVCTLVQAIHRRSRYVRVRPHRAMLYSHSMFLSATYFMAWREGVPHIFDTSM